MVLADTRPKAPASGQGHYPPSGQAWTACAILTLGCVLAYMDRGILSLFIQPIQRDLGLSDTEISLLIGLAFSMFNALFGLPVGRLIDGGNRKRIAAAGIFIWSAANSLCGLAGNFAQLFAARIGVGAGEAAVTPAAVSLLADYFPPDRRGSAMGIFYSGMYLGIGGVLLLGGWLWRVIGDRMLVLPLLGPLHSWQVILIGFGSLGLIVGPLTLLMREPSRLNDHPGGPSVTGAVPVREVARFYRANARTLFGHNMGFCLQTFALHAGAAWLPVILIRTQGWSLPQAGFICGVMMMTLAPAGAILAGILADRLMAQGRVDARLVVAMGAALATGLSCAGIGLFQAPVAAMAAIMAFSFFGPFVLPLGPGALQEIMPNAMRGQAIAIYTFIINSIAAATAATIVALITDMVFHDQGRVNQAFAIVGVLGSAGAVIVLAVTRAPFRALRLR